MCVRLFHFWSYGIGSVLVGKASQIVVDSPRIHNALVLNGCIVLCSRVCYHCWLVGVVRAYPQDLAKAIIIIIIAG